ncbi:MAG: 1-acyl-sn-glycerol-3-phosphate acyltransferase [Bacteroidales bacterium]|jgi:putative hemolysin|nr:1-acyl-sn-glycerol-3-phosphate acyltransferase [Bacteroidales bacterium]
MIIKKYIDLDEVLRKKNPRLYKFLPRFILHWLKRIICQDEVNEVLTKLDGLEGIEKMQKFLQLENISLVLHGKEHIPETGRFIFASNHPLGGADGIIFMVAVSHFFSNIKFLVNDILLFLPGVKNIFVPLNTYGKQSKAAVEEINKVYSSENQVLIFPAGMVSRKQKGRIADLEWHKSFVNAAKKYERNIIPVYIDGCNSNFFYNLANARKFFGIRVNIEMLFLVSEMFKQKNNTINIYFGEQISYKSLTNMHTSAQWAQKIKEQVYTLKQ